MQLRLRFDEIRFNYEPYPIGIAHNVLPQEHYAQLVAAWPATELFEFKPMLGNKYSLSEVNNSRNYRRFVHTQPAWGELHGYVKTRGFIEDVVAMLYERHMDVGLGGQFLVKRRAQRTLLDRLKILRRIRGLSARFEYSMLPADGGFIKPHTDSPEKIITLVLSMMAPGEWDANFGGGTDVLKPIDITRNYNQMNRQFEFDQMQALDSFPFEPNQCVIFIKTFNSWHAVQPLRGVGSKVMRKTLTINIEAK